MSDRFPRQLIARAAPPAGFALALACVAGSAGQVVAQDGSLLSVPPALQQQPKDRGLTLENSSYIYRKLPPEQEMRELRVNDIITVLVDYRSSMLSEGDAENRKTNNINAFLNNWVKFTGKDLTPDPQPNGPLAVSGHLQSQFRVESDIELRDQLTFRIASHIADIQPNGNLVIEGHAPIRINEEVWQQSLTGIVRRTGVGVDRPARRDEITDLRIEKREMG